jgi:hypothetical protein
MYPETVASTKKHFLNGAFDKICDLNFENVMEYRPSPPCRVTFSVIRTENVELRSEKQPVLLLGFCFGFSS